MSFQGLLQNTVTEILKSLTLVTCSDSESLKFCVCPKLIVTSNRNAIVIAAFICIDFMISTPQI